MAGIQMLRASLLKFCRKILEEHRYNVTQISMQHIDAREGFNDPRAIGFYGKPVVIDAPLEWARWKAWGSPFDQQNPLVKIVRKSMQSLEDPYNILYASLQDYYYTVQPSCMEECMGFDRAYFGTEFPQPSHTHATRWPWVDIPFDKRELTPVYKNQKMVYEEASEHGVQHWGPITEEKLETEAYKFHRLIGSIRTRGFLSRPNAADGYIRAQVLYRHGRGWRWIPIQGQHRVIVCAAMDMDVIPIKAVSLVRFEDMAFWPLVRDGVFSYDDAAKAFDRVFEGHAPDAIKQYDCGGVDETPLGTSKNADPGIISSSKWSVQPG